VYLIGPAAASFSLCLLAMFALRPVAIAVDLIDRPGGRKGHTGDIPVVGGLGMLLGIILGTGLLPLPDWTAGTLLAACSMLVTVGLIDDRFDLSPWTRLSVQIAASLTLIFGAGTTVNTLGAPFGEPILLHGFASYAATAIAMVAAVNAFNMLDGMDGLAGALAMVALFALAILASQDGQTVSLSVSVVIMAAVAAFLISNLPIELNRSVRCFMGDSGSTLLGILVAWLCVEVSQAETPAAQPITMLWIVAIPLYDLCWTVIRRSIRGIPPFRSDQGHFHHLVLQAGFGVKGAFILLILLAILLATLGIAIDYAGIPDSWSLALLVLAGAFIVKLLNSPDLIWRLVPKAYRNAKQAIPD
jgi:UDP-GlcNAc:undecaprenyl-phosphate/decaprenyl-phosphate GlcNAc-1-phosphate transferase